MKYKSMDDYWKRFDAILATPRGMRWYKYKMAKHYARMFSPPIPVIPA